MVGYVSKVIFLLTLLLLLLVVFETAKNGKGEIGSIQGSHLVLRVSMCV
jgi:hypothetical protein